MKHSVQPFVFDQPAFDDHEQVIFCADAAAGLRAIIAIHDTTLGPALGGTRMWAYASQSEALDDVLRLAQGMTYKNALADIPYGGGKAVIIGDAGRDKTADLLRAFGRHIDRLGGNMVTGEDVGISMHDADIIARETAHIRGTSASASGDPAPYTALGVFAGLEAVAVQRLGLSTLQGVSICVQGLGSVGMRLCQLLHGAGAGLTVSDIDDSLVRRATDRFGAQTVAPALAHAANVDIYAPCALGGVLNRNSIPQIRAKAIAGSANSQLEREGDSERLRERGILYAPDYVINAGGVLSIALEGPNFDPQRLRNRVLDIGKTLHQVFNQADAEALPTDKISDRMAEERLARARKRSPVAALSFAG